ncbi:aminodeoxychorismate synthase component I [Terricaulis silvestris]|uniref:aminodeoxychorismate synthase component I n=1 Tax=Terricaulis silvestris TaxID=2686094 RepID=UPI001E2EDE1D|nr:aminodeoxychorismate synthase component I [Terricaulis silvestris]
MKLLSDSDPFVLFEDARPGGSVARLFTGPCETVVAWTLDEVAPALEALRAGLKRGRHAAGWFSYEAGHEFEPRLAARVKRRDAGAFPLVWFGLFERAELVTREALERALPDGAGAWLSAPRPRMTRAAYAQKFARTQCYIADGDVYQINLSYRADLTVLGDPLAAYARLRGAGQGGWSAVVYNGDQWLLSTSPELFFRLSDGAIEARPMKGTAKRRSDPEADRLVAEALRRDPKELAENVMIVDLLRNDISRLAKRGSVHVSELFKVETYPTLHTLTSTVKAEIEDKYDAVDVLRTLFPCGSITGAPKIRAMEIIDELETDERGAYTGSIGWMAPDGSAEFNVAIRTIAIDGARAEVGLGAAVVADSTLDGEWEECRTKGAFITANAPAFDLIETMRFEPGAGVSWIELHLARLEASARTFGFGFDAAGIRDAIAAAIAGAAPSVVRLLLGADGLPRIELKPLPAFPAAGASVAVAPLPVDARDFRLRHKTTLRDFYDDARAGSDADEVVFLDGEGFVTEGSFTNVFVERDGMLVTPPLMRGLLPGVLRADLIASGRAREGDLRAADLGRGFFVGNAVRGLVAARLATPVLRRAAS